MIDMTALGRIWGLIGLAMLCHGVVARPPGHETEQALLAERSMAPRRRLHGRFLHITDIHPDPFYKAYSSTDEDGACHRGSGPAGVYGAETTGCDSPHALVNATFDWIAANLRDEIDFVVWTGDSARHDRDEKLPRNADQVLGANRWIADRLAQLFADERGPGLSIPVVPNFGNNDILPHNILRPGPNKWLRQYAHIWRHFIPEEQRHSFEFGGWFQVEVVPGRLAVFSVNTMYFFDRNAGVDGCASPSEPGYKQLEWLRVQLQLLRGRGMKAILIGHVPPARTESKRLWDETCWHKYALWMRQFRDVVVAGLYGHMNIDHFLIHDEKDIDPAALVGSPKDNNTRETMGGGEISLQSASDYLVELREHWSKLTPPPRFAGKPRAGKDKDGRRGERDGRHKDPWSERYHLSLIGPSVVPTYFPTLRVLEYNITGLEDNPVWKDVFQATGTGTAGVTSQGEQAQKHLDLRHLSAVDADADAEAEDDNSRPEDSTTTNNRDKSNNNNNNNKKKNPKRPVHDDPDLVMPDPPPKSAPPGPAYSPQPLTLTGYTQYFANLTHINNNNNNNNNLELVGPAEAAEESEAARSIPASWLPLPSRWRPGKHAGKKKPVRPPREFAFEVEYSTFDDRVYRLADLTVSSVVDLAVRIGGGGSARGEEGDLAVVGGEEEEEEEEGWDDEQEDEEGAEEEDGNDDGDGEAETEEEKMNKEKGKKGKKRRKRKMNKTWLHFLEYAFVRTRDRDELKKLF